MSLVSSVRGVAANSQLAKGVYHVVRRRRRALRELDAYVPFSSGSLRQLTDLTYQAVSQTPVLLDDLGQVAGAPRAVKVGMQEFWRMLGSVDPEPLGSLLDRHGSDKAGRHDYYLAYAGIVDALGTPAAMLEVGLGSNNTDVPSNMGPPGSPGASLRAFRDYVQGCHVYGADVDRRVLFSEDRIDTFHVDQTDANSVRALAESLPDGLDLVIDDGLHTPNANLAVLCMALRKVRRGGWIVIEDINPAAESLWEAVAGLMPGHECYLVESRAALLFCVRTPDAPVVDYSTRPRPATSR